jgi:hypothetical protein
MIFQKKNKRTGAYQKYKSVKGKGVIVTDVKQVQPGVPFKNVRIKRK